jgi:plastocyanin
LRLDVKSRRYAVASVVALSGFGALFMALPGRGAGLKVDMFRFRYTPAAITVNVGEAATFYNKTRLTHTATCPGCGVDSGDIQPQMFFTLTFPKAGRFELYCRYHRDSNRMTSVVTVKP